jgi:hypothetical protein
MQLVERPGDDHAGPALAFVRFDNDRERHPLSLHEGLNSIELLGLGQRAGNQLTRRDAIP